MNNNVQIIKGVVCEFAPGEKVYFTLEGLEKEPRDAYDSELARLERFFEKLMNDHFSSYIQEEVQEGNTPINMTKAINEFYEKNNNPNHYTGRHCDFISNVYENLGLAVTAYGGSDFDEDLGCIDSNGNYVIPRIYQIEMAYGDGLFATYNSSLAGGYINIKNEIELPFSYKVVGTFKNGYAVVKTLDGEIQYIDKTGKPVMRITDLYRINNDTYCEVSEEQKTMN